MTVLCQVRKVAAGVMRKQQTVGGGQETKH